MELLWASFASTLGLVSVAILTFGLNERAKRVAAWKEKKLQYYADFVDALGQNLEGYATSESQASFAREANNMLLFASPEVLSTLQDYVSDMSINNLSANGDLDSVLLTELI